MDSEGNDVPGVHGLLVPGGLPHGLSPDGVPFLDGDDDPGNDEMEAPDRFEGHFFDFTPIEPLLPGPAYNLLTLAAAGGLER